MKEFLTTPISKNISRIALLSFVILCSILFIYRISTYTYLTVEFNDARPVRNKIPVYYKGYRIGKVEKIRPSHDFQSTKVTLVLYPKHLKLPNNTTALLTREKRENRFETDFINLIYPENPSDINLKDGDNILGITTVDIESFFSEKAISGELDAITHNANTLLEELQTTSQALTLLMNILQDTVNENRPSIKIMTSNLAEMSNQFRIFATKLNSSINENELQSTFGNFNKTSENFTKTSNNLNSITENINNKNQQISNTLTDVEKVANNVAIITTGLKNTMSKNFAGFRLLFGKPIKQINCKDICD